MMMLMIVAKKHELGPFRFEHRQQRRGVHQRLARWREAGEGRMMR